MKSDLDPVFGIRNGILAMLVVYLAIWLLAGCTTAPRGPRSQIIKWSGTFHLHKDKHTMNNYCKMLGSKSPWVRGCYDPKTNILHTTTWDDCNLGHEVKHGLAYRGKPMLITDDDHFKVKRKLIIRKKGER